MHGVGLRDERRKLRVFGRPKRSDPEGRSLPAPDFLPGIRELEYPGVSFGISRTGWIRWLMVYGEGSRTRKGVAVGDLLDSARSIYGAGCKGESDGHLYAPAQCVKRLGPGRYIAFTGRMHSNRIGSIALSSEPFGSGCGENGSAERRCRLEARTGRSHKYTRFDSYSR